MDFNGKVVLVTGAASGIGEDAAIGFAKSGAKVILVDLNESGLNDVSKKIISLGGPTPLVIAADITKETSRIIDESIAHFSRLDVLVNSAGILRLDNPTNINLDVFDKVFDVNVRSTVELIKLAIPHLEKTKGNVVNVSSVSGLRTQLNSISYCMSKAAIDMYTKCAARELGPKGIRVNAISPGCIKTHLLEAELTQTQIKDLFDEQINICPVKRVGNVSDTTNAILFLANEQSSFITGTCLSVDGGSLHV